MGAPSKQSLWCSGQRPAPVGSQPEICLGQHTVFSPSFFSFSVGSLKYFLWPVGLRMKNDIENDCAQIPQKMTLSHFTAHNNPSSAVSSPLQVTVRIMAIGGRELRVCTRRHKSCAHTPSVSWQWKHMVRHRAELSLTSSYLHQGTHLLSQAICCSRLDVREEDRDRRCVYLWHLGLRSAEFTSALNGLRRPTR